MQGRAGPKILHTITKIRKKILMEFLIKFFLTATSTRRAMLTISTVHAVCCAPGTSRRSWPARTVGAQRSAAQRDACDGSRPQSFLVLASQSMGLFFLWQVPGALALAPAPRCSPSYSSGGRRSVAVSVKSKAARLHAARESLQKRGVALYYKPTNCPPVICSRCHLHCRHHY